MPKYTFDFELEAWIRGVEIEADSYDEALEILLGEMTVEELVSKGSVEDFDLNDIDCDVEDDEDYE